MSRHQLDVSVKSRAATTAITASSGTPLATIESVNDYLLLELLILIFFSSRIEQR
jgi:hypothetical protein